MPITGPWPEPVGGQVAAALQQAAAKLQSLEARVEGYALDSGGYTAVLHEARTFVYSLEARLGPSPRRDGHSVHAHFHVFDPNRPNLAFLRILERRDGDGTPTLDPRLPLYTRTLDQMVCHTLIPVLNQALNPLDPTGKGRSLHVDCWHGRVTARDLPDQPRRTIDLLKRRKADGQLALIWTDFHDPLAQAAVSLLRPFIARHDLHLIPRVATPSALRTPMQTHEGRLIQVAGLSTAVDRGLAIADRYTSSAGLQKIPEEYPMMGFPADGKQGRARNAETSED